MTQPDLQANESVLYTHEAQELTLALEEVRGERDILREENSRLMGDVFSGEKEKTFKHNERKLRVRYTIFSKDHLR